MSATADREWPQENAGSLHDHDRQGVGGNGGPSLEEDQLNEGGGREVRGLLKEPKYNASHLVRRNDNVGLIWHRVMALGWWPGKTSDDTQLAVHVREHMDWKTGVLTRDLRRSQSVRTFAAITGLKTTMSKELLQKWMLLRVIKRYIPGHGRMGSVEVDIEGLRALHRRQLANIGPEQLMKLMRDEADQYSDEVVEAASCALKAQSEVCAQRTLAEEGVRSAHGTVCSTQSGVRSTNGSVCSSTDRVLPPTTLSDLSTFPARRSSSVQRASRREARSAEPSPNSAVPLPSADGENGFCGGGATHGIEDVDGLKGATMECVSAIAKAGGISLVDARNSLGQLVKQVRDGDAVRAAVLDIWDGKLAKGEGVSGSLRIFAYAYSRDPLRLKERMSVARRQRQPRLLTTAEQETMTSEEIVEHEMPEASPGKKAERAAAYRALGKGR